MMRFSLFFSHSVGVGCDTGCEGGSCYEFFKEAYQCINDNKCMPADSEYCDDILENSNLYQDFFGNTYDEEGNSIEGYCSAQRSTHAVNTVEFWAAHNETSCDVEVTIDYTTRSLYTLEVNGFTQSIDFEAVANFQLETSPMTTVTCLDCDDANPADLILNIEDEAIPYGPSESRTFNFQVCNLYYTLH